MENPIVELAPVTLEVEQAVDLVINDLIKIHAYRSADNGFVVDIYSAKNEELVETMCVFDEDLEDVED